MNIRRAPSVSHCMKFCVTHGFDRLAAILAAFVAYKATPVGQGIGTWCGGAAIIVFVALAVRPE